MSEKMFLRDHIINFSYDLQMIVSHVDEKITLWILDLSHDVLISDENKR